MELEAERAVLLQPGEGETVVDRPQRTLRILAACDQLTLTWFRYEPGEEGPDPHVHRRHADAFHVLEGELELGLGPEVRRMLAAAGTLVAAPPNVVHTFRNASDATVVFLNIHAPNTGFAEMLRARRDGRTVETVDYDQFEPPADGGRPLSDAVFRRAGDGESIAIGESSAAFKAEGSDVDGFFSLTETTLAPGFRGPPRTSTALSSTPSTCSKARSRSSSPAGGSRRAPAPSRSSRRGTRTRSQICPGSASACST